VRAKVEGLGLGSRLRLGLGSRLGLGLGLGSRLGSGLGAGLGLGFAWTSLTSAESAVGPFFSSDLWHVLHRRSCILPLALCMAVMVSSW